MEVQIDAIKEQLQAALKLVEDLNLKNDKDVNQTQEISSHLGDLPYKVIHFKNNPVQQALNTKENCLKQLRETNERISARLELLESGNDADVTRKIDDAINTAQELEQLKNKLKEYEMREEKILKSFKKTSREFREVSYLLTGYRIDALKDRIYRLSNMYAENQDDVLLFEISPVGEIQLLQNSYTDKVTNFVETYLRNADSFPAFLSAITLDLFKSSTQLMQVSMNITRKL